MTDTPKPAPATPAATPLREANQQRVDAAAQRVRQAMDYRKYLPDDPFRKDVELLIEIAVAPVLEIFAAAQPAAAPMAAPAENYDIDDEPTDEEYKTATDFLWGTNSKPTVGNVITFMRDLRRTAQPQRDRRAIKLEDGGAMGSHDVVERESAAPAAAQPQRESEDVIETLPCGLLLSDVTQRESEPMKEFKFRGKIVSRTENFVSVESDQSLQHTFRVEELIGESEQPPESQAMAFRAEYDTPSGGRVFCIVSEKIDGQDWLKENNKGNGRIIPLFSRGQFERESEQPEQALRERHKRAKEWAERSGGSPGERNYINAYMHGYFNVPLTSSRGLEGEIIKQFEAALSPQTDSQEPR